MADVGARISLTAKVLDRPMTDLNQLKPQHDVTTRAPETVAGVRPVRKAYEQIADQLRALIVDGDLIPGQRLPTEAALGSQFGVSRATIREALRTLAAQNLIRTAKGTGGGSYIAIPSRSSLRDLLHANLGLLSSARAIKVEDLMEMRELLEIPAARLAAERRTDIDIASLTYATAAELPTTANDSASRNDVEFHTAVITAAHNDFLTIAAVPIFSVLQASLRRLPLTRGFDKRVHSDHAAIATAIEQRDGKAAARVMAEHLTYLRPLYQPLWREPDAEGDNV
jgi:DNA-binding FadR family transcriptional regulator